MEICIYESELGRALLSDEHSLETTELNLPALVWCPKGSDRYSVYCASDFLPSGILASVFVSGYFSEVPLPATARWAVDPDEKEDATKLAGLFMLTAETFKAKSTDVCAVMGNSAD